MKKSLLSIDRLLAVGALALVANFASAQCMTYENGPYNDFVTMFGGAPCDDGTGCPMNEIDDFEIWASEAYVMPDIQEGGTYTFSACNSVGGSAWPITFTIISPSEQVDAFGTDVGSSCAITWTASEGGTYLILVNEDGQCGATGNPNESVDNGFPSIACTSSPATLCGSIGIDEIAHSVGVNVYPNPTNGLFTVEMSDLTNGNAVIDVVDLSGRTIRTMNVAQGGRMLQVLDLSGEPTGAYVVRVITADGVVTAPIMLSAN